jgi:hypothetical protein
MSTTIVANRVTSSSTSSSQIKQEHVKDENDNSSNNNEDFFEDWKVGNWCWERNYNKYPAVSFANNNNNNNNNNSHDNDVGGINDKSREGMIKNESTDDDRKLCDNDHDNSSNSNIDERKPAAIQSSSFDSGRVTTASAMEILAVTKKDAREIPISKNPQIKVGKNEENNTNDINDSNNENNKNDDDDDDDDSFYDDWVEGNWCLLKNYDSSCSNNKSNEGDDGDDDDNNSPRKIQHEIMTPSSLRKISRNNNNNDSAKRKLNRFRCDDDDSSYNQDEDEAGEESDDEDNNDDNEEEEEFIPEDNKDAHNHQEDKRPAKKWSQRQIYYGNHRDQLWMGMFQKLVEYKKHHKNTTVTQRYCEDPKLRLWVSTQRRCRYNNDVLRPDRNDLLNSIGFEWDGLKCKAVTDQMIWMVMFQKLVAYKNQHKNTMVPFHYEKDRKLGHWVPVQRQNYKNEELLPKRADLLKSIGFEWDGAKEHCDKLWMGMFQKLVVYKEMHKNSMVPSHYQEDPKLGRWVCKQRKIYKNEELLPKRIALLKSIGFT